MWFETAVINRRNDFLIVRYRLILGWKISKRDYDWHEILAFGVTIAIRFPPVILSRYTYRSIREREYMIQIYAPLNLRCFTFMFLHLLA